MTDSRFFRRYLDILDEQMVAEPPKSSIRHIVGARPKDDEYGEYNEPPPEGTVFTNPDVDPFDHVAQDDPRIRTIKGPAALQGTKPSNQRSLKQERKQK